MDSHSSSFGDWLLATGLTATVLSLSYCSLRQETIQMHEKPPVIVGTSIPSSLEPKERYQRHSPDSDALLKQDMQVHAKAQYHSFKSWSKETLDSISAFLIGGE